MKINKLSQKKRISLVVAILISVSAGMAVAVVISNDRSVNNLGKTNKGTPIEINGTQDSLNNEEQTSPKPDDIDKRTNTDQPLPPAKDVATGKLTASVSTSNSIADEIVYIRGGIDNSVVFTGSCYAQLNGPNGQSIRKDTELLQNASTTDCRTIQIKVSDLSQGRWKYTLNYISENMEGSSSETSFDIN